MKNRLIGCTLIALHLLSNNAQATNYILPPEDQSMIGEMQFTTIGRSTTLSDQARLFNVGFNEIRLANKNIDAWLPNDNSKVLIPTQHILPSAKREGIVINIPEMRLFYFPKRSEYANESSIPRVYTYPISIGRGQWETPLGETMITTKTANPDWRPPESIKKEHLEAGDPLPDVVPAGPNNPLGQYALRLGLPSYLIHGTNKPYGIGMRVTHGCIRLYPENIEELFYNVSEQTPVNIIHEPYKLGRHLSWVYLEAHPLANEDGSYDFDIEELKNAVTRFNQTLPSGWKINWRDAIRIARSATGIPTIVKVDKPFENAK